MFDDNPRFQEFRAQLEERGVHLRAMWSAKIKPTRFDNVCLFVAYGRNDIAIHTMIVQDYGADNGFGIWFEPKTNGIDSDVAAILGETVKESS